MNPVMYLISSPSVPMSKGKFGAQAAHAAVEAYKASPDNWLKHCWDERGKQYAKIVLITDNLLIAQRYIEARGFNTVLIIDEGRTEFNGDLTPTFLGVQIVDKDDANVQATFSAFKLYRDDPPPNKILTVDHSLRPSKAEQIRKLLETPLRSSPLEEGKRSLITKLKERINGYTTRRDSRRP